MNKRQKEVIQHNLDNEKAVLKQLEKQYQAALDDINTKIKILQSDELTQSRIYRIEHQQALKGQVEAILDKLHSDEYDSINKYLTDSYTDAFVGTMYDLHGQGVPLITPIDQKAAVKAVMTDSQINEGLYKHLGVDTKNLKKAIQNEITRGIATGMPYSEIARNISNTTKAPLARANTIVRTEAHRIQQASTHDAQVKAKDKGADIVKQWDASLDGATRPTHRQLDGQIREIDEPFKAHGKSAMYPGDFGDPAEDCNCRCVTLQRAKWALGEEELQTLKDRAEFFELDKSKDFEDFKKKYLKAAEKSAETLEKSTKSSIIKLPDILIGKSVGAKSKNYEVMDLATGEMFRFVEGTRLQDVEVFAGKGSSKVYNNAYKYADAHGGKVEDWQHVKGKGWLQTTDGDRRAEAHWSQCEGIGKHDFFVKRWLDE